MDVIWNNVHENALMQGSTNLLIIIISIDLHIQIRDLNDIKFDPIVISRRSSKNHCYSWTKSLWYSFWSQWQARRSSDLKGPVSRGWGICPRQKNVYRTCGRQLSLKCKTQQKAINIRTNLLVQRNPRHLIYQRMKNFMQVNFARKRNSKTKLL